MNRQKKLVINILKKYGLGRVNIDNLMFIIEDCGYEIVEYTENNSIISSIGLSEYSKANNGFTFCNKNLKFVFVKEELEIKEKEYVLAHELGHILNNHLDSSSIYASVTEEQDANEFAHYLLNISLLAVLSVRVHCYKKVIIIALITMVVIITSLICMNHYEKYNYNGDYYVTEYGEKYHDEDCIIIKNKNNVHKMTMEEYESGEYSPCNVCLSDKQ